jgi:hypothetical protein
MRGSAVIPVFIVALVPFLVIALVILSSLVGFVQWRPPVVWSDQFGASNANSGVTDVAADNGSLYAVGYLNGTSGSINGVPVVRKYDFKGDLTWVKDTLDEQKLLVSGAAIGSDGLYLVGSGSQNSSIFKYDFNGNYVWKQHVGFSGAGMGIFSTPSGIYLSGESDQYFLFLREYGPNGSIDWTSDFSNVSSALDTVTGLYADSSTVFVLTGGPLIGFDLAGIKLWSTPLGVPFFIDAYSISGDGASAYVSGSASSSAFARPTGFLTKYDGKGSIVWNSVFDSPDQSGVADSSVWTDSTGVYVSFASIEGNEFVLKFDFSGHQVWGFKAPTPLGPLLSLTGHRTFIGTAVPGGFILAGVSTQSASGGTRGLLQEFSGAPSLIFFGINPPLSFVILGGLIAGSTASVLAFRKLRRKRTRPSRIGPPPQILPSTD